MTQCDLMAENLVALRLSKSHTRSSHCTKGLNYVTMEVQTVHVFPDGVYFFKHGAFREWIISM